MLLSPRSTAGFTLVEIMIVVLLMSILAMAVIPSASPSVHDELTSVAQILAADLGYGRSLAVLNNDRYQFQFDLTNNQYTLSYSGSNSAFSTLPPSPFQSSQDPAGQYVVRLANLPRLGIPVTLYAVQSLTPQPVEVASVEFGPLGATTQSQPTVIWLSAGAAPPRGLSPYRSIRQPVWQLSAVFKPRFRRKRARAARAPPALLVDRRKAAAVRNPRGAPAIRAAPT